MNTKPDSTCGELIIIVEDTGIGIKNEDIQRIFQPFEQAKGHKVAKFGGTLDW